MKKKFEEHQINIKNLQLLRKEIKNNQIIYNSLTKKQEEVIGELSLEQILAHYTLFEDKAALKLYNDNKKNTDAAYSRRMVSPFKTTLPICTSLFLVHFIPKCTSKINLQVFNFNIPFYSINKEALSRIFSEKIVNIGWHINPNCLSCLQKLPQPERLKRN